MLKWSSFLHTWWGNHPNWATFLILFPSRDYISNCHIFRCIIQIGTSHITMFSSPTWEWFISLNSTSCTSITMPCVVLYTLQVLLELEYPSKSPSTFFFQTCSTECLPWEYCICIQTRTGVWISASYVLFVVVLSFGVPTPHPPPPKKTSVQFLLCQTHNCPPWSRMWNQNLFI